MSSINAQIVKALKSKATNERAVVMIRYFKTGKDQYGAGDVFHGVSVPDQRNIAKQFYKQANTVSIRELLQSKFHEERLTALFMLTLHFEDSFKKGGGKEWVDLYLDQTTRVNNWDLVDATAYKILGRWLADKNKNILYKLAASTNLWENRIAIVATLYFIKRNDFVDVLELSKKMLFHSHDLMHKAVGWMLREAWSINPPPIERFLQEYAPVMPRTTLRYAIEKMTASKRKYFLNLKNHTFKS